MGNEINSNLENVEISNENYLKLLDKIISMEEENKETLLINYFTKIGPFANVNSIIEVFHSEISSIAVLICIYEKFKKEISDESSSLIANLLDISPATFITLLDNPTDTSFFISSILLHKNYAFTTNFLRQVFVSFGSLSQNAIRTFSVVIRSISTDHFVDYENFTFLMNHESQHIRVSFVEIIENLIQRFKVENKISEIAVLTKMLRERLKDINFSVRSRVVSAFSILFRTTAVLKEERNTVVKQVAERIADKTVVVRKKALNLLIQIIVDHPYKNRPLLIPVEETEGAQLSEYETDFNMFVETIEGAVNMAVLLLDCYVKTDVAEIFSFLKYAYIYSVRNSTNGLLKMLNSIFIEEYKNAVIDAFKDLFVKKRDFIFDFSYNKGFEELVQYLPIDTEALFVNLKKQTNVPETIYIIRCLNKQISAATGFELLRFSTDRLFASKNDFEIQQNIEMYKNVLSILLRLSTTSSQFHEEILKTITGNICRMRFYEDNLISRTIRVCYVLSKAPEITAQGLLKNLIKSKDQIKVIDCLGCIAWEEGKRISDLERYWIANKSNLREINDLESVLAGVQVPMDLLMKSDKVTEEEIREYCEKMREEDLLFNPRNLLSSYIDDLIKGCTDRGNLDLQRISLITLCRWMLVSSVAFHRYYDKVYIKILLDSETAANVKNTLVVFIHDFVKLYNPFVDYELLFRLVLDRSIRKNVILIIYDLLVKKIIRINGNSSIIVARLNDDEIGPIVRTILKNLSKSSNCISAVFFESFVDFDIPSDSIVYLSRLLPMSIKEGLFLKCAKTALDLINNNQNDQNTSSAFINNRIQAVFDEFHFKEKFINENYVLFSNLNINKK